MSTTDRLIADLVKAAGGEVVGRIRLQKLFYLLTNLGMNGDLEFRYHHYGPYSRSLDDAIDFAKFIHGVVENISYRKSDGLPYSIFVCRSSDDNGIDPRVRSMSSMIRRLNSKSSTVLELAATIHWLKYVERVDPWDDEVVRRKGSKTANGRLEEASELLAQIGLS